jgi:tetratricopeptide (TPR) repeat protein
MRRASPALAVLLAIALGSPALAQTALKPQPGAKPPSSAPAQAQPKTGFQFFDARPLSPDAPLVTKPWKAEEKAKVDAMLKTLAQQAPGLSQRAIQYRPVRIFRTETLGHEDRLVGTINSEHTLLVSDRFFKSQAGPGAVASTDPYFALIREVAHLADSANRASATKDWVSLAQPLLEKARAKAKEAKTTLADLALKGEDQFARDFGLPTILGAFRVDEALADFAAAFVVKKDFSATSEIKAYVEKHILAPAGKAEEAVKKFHQALDTFENGKVDEAIKQYDQAIKLDPNFREAYLDRGLIYKYKGQWDKAIADFDQGVKLSFGEAPVQVYFERGLVKAQKGDFDQAIADLTASIERSPSPYLGFIRQAYGLRAEAFMVKKDYQKAAADYSKVLELDPKSAYSYKMRGRARYEMADANGAIADYTKSIELDDKDPDIFFMRGYAYGSQKKFAEAKADLERSLQMSPKMEPLAKPALDFVNAEMAKAKKK